MRSRARLYLALIAWAVTACTAGGEPFTSPVVLGGVEVDPDTLEQGRAVYTRTCAACHGDHGDGRGPTAPSLTVPPRDFTTGLFKYGGVPSGELPTDQDLLRVVRRGLPGTPMLAWSLTDDEQRAVVQYLKTFSPRWRTEVAPPRIQPTPDPWRDRPREAIARGAALFHVEARCADCHGAYEPDRTLRAMSRALTGKGPARLGPFARTPQRSEYFAGSEPVLIVPPDLLEDPIRNGARLEDLYRTIAAGIGGTSMPTWQGSLSEEDLWAVVHYTRSVVER